MDRLPAILITAIVTALGLLRLATITPGDKIKGPMVIVILSGLITAIMLTLLVLPRLSFLRFTLSPTGFWFVIHDPVNRLDWQNQLNIRINVPGRCFT